MISLAPPRKPASTTAKDRNWTLVVVRPSGVDHVQLHGTRSDDPEGAQAEAARYLGQIHAWEPYGTGYRSTNNRKETSK